MSATPEIITRVHDRFGVLECFLIGDSVREVLRLPNRRDCPELEHLFRRVAWSSSLPGIQVRHSHVAYSRSFPDPQPVRGKRDILRSGIWVTAADLRWSSAPSKRTVAGIGVDEASAQLVCRSWPLLSSPATSSALVVGYHGTSASLYDAIAPSGTVRESEMGMTGRGVYLTNFWKASARYALLDADYRPRPEGGIVVRCYVVAKNSPATGDLYFRDLGKDDSPVCSCSTTAPCVERRRVGTPQLIALCRASDHDSLWRRDPLCIGTYVSSEWSRAVSNEEWCVRGEHVVIASIHRVDPQTRSTRHFAGTRYDPLDRDVSIA